MKTGANRTGSRGTGRVTCLALLLFSFTAVLPCAGEQYRNAADGILNMEYADGRLSLETKSAPLDKVLHELSRLAEVEIVSDGPLDDKVTVYVSDLPTDAAAKKILRGKDLSFLYRANENAESGEEYRLREIRIYISQGSTGREQTFSYDKNRSKTRQDAIRERKKRQQERMKSRARLIPDRTPRDEAASDTDKFLSGLLGGNLNAMDEVADQLKQDHPEAEEKIEQFLEPLEEAKARAAESGADLSTLEGLGGMGVFMQRMMEGKQNR